MADPYSIIASYPNAGQAFATAYSQGQEQNRQQRIRQSIAALSAGNNPDALRQLYADDPQTAMSMENQLYQRSERQREADSRAALGDYYSNPNDQGAAARAASADPEKFITFQGKRLDATKTDLSNAIQLHDMSMQLLGGVHDQASYDQAKASARSLYAQYGKDFDSLNLPDTYSPDLVHDLQMQGMDTSKQLSAIARENNVDSQIEDRQGRLEEYTRHNQAMENNQRRGQDMRANGTGKPAVPKAPTPTTVIGAIMAKQARGEQLTPAEAKTYNEYRTAKAKPTGGHGGGQSTGLSRPQNRAEYDAIPSGTRFVDPNGNVRVKP
jgi:hypothetical protein